MLFGGTKALRQRPLFSQIILDQPPRPRGNDPYDLADIARAMLGVVSENGDGIKMFATLKGILPGFSQRITPANGKTAFVPIQLAYGQSGTGGAGREAISGG